MRLRSEHFIVTEGEAKNTAEEFSIFSRRIIMLNEIIQLTVMKKKRQMSTAGKNRLSTEQHLVGWEHVGRVLLKGNILATLK